MKKQNFKIVTIGIVHFTDDHLKFVAKNVGIAPSELVRIDSESRLRIRGKDAEAKIKERSESAYAEHFWALQSDYVIVNPHGEDDKDAWGKRTWGVELVINQFCEIIKKYKNQKIFLILNGPSCVGKGPLGDVFFNEIAKKENLKIGKCILSVDKEQRKMRLGESEGNPYYFTTLDDITSKSNSNPNNFIMFDVRSVRQMIDLDQVDDLLKSNDIVFLEIHYSAIPLLKALV